MPRVWGGASILDGSWRDGQSWSSRGRRRPVLAAGAVSTEAGQPSSALLTFTAKPWRSLRILLDTAVQGTGAWMWPVSPLPTLHQRKATQRGRRLACPSICLLVLRIPHVCP